MRLVNQRISWPARVYPLKMLPATCSMPPGCGGMYVLTRAILMLLAVLARLNVVTADWDVRL